MSVWPGGGHAMGNNKRGRGRPKTSNQVRIVPVPHQPPDARKLGRAFLALALHQAELEAAAQRQDKKRRDGGSDE